MGTHNIILINVRNEFVPRESPLAAGAEITPGMWIELSSGSVQPHSSASAVPSPLCIAVEMPFRPKSAGSNLGSGINDPYDQEGENVPYHYALAGDVLNCLLAAGEDITEGTLLESDGAGGVQAGASTFLRALEDVDNSASYEYARIKVEVL